jgi:hypothetical protein
MTGTERFVEPEALLAVYQGFLLAFVALQEQLEE